MIFNSINKHYAKEIDSLKIYFVALMFYYVFLILFCLS